MAYHAIPYIGRSGISRTISLYPKIFLREFRLRLQLAAAAFKDHPALDQDDSAIADRRDCRVVLVDDDGGDAGGANFPEDAPDILGDQRREAFRRFVEDEQFQIGE